MRNKHWIILSVLLVASLLLAACGAAAATPDPKAPKPSNAGGTGKALTLTGNVANGEKVFVDKCETCHGKAGVGGVANDGSDDGTVPALAPIDPGLANKDAKVFAANVDLFVEHGSTPSGKSPAKSMLAFGDNNLLQAQEIADVIAYVISLNPAK